MILPPAPANLHTVPISDRVSRTSWVQTYLSLGTFLLGCLIVHATQYLVLPLLLVNRGWYLAGIAYTKRSFGTLLVLMCQWFAPTKFVVTTEGMDDSVLLKDVMTDKVVGLKFPQKLIIISNHQVYPDWWYLWAFAYFANVHSNVLIVLKQSLKWVPVLGWAMQFFDFIFLARSWDADRIQLGIHLTRLGKRAQEQDDPLALIIYPEGTLVSKDTRPLSKKYADKQGIEDLTHCLLPRSTGLHFALRTLAPYVPDLHVLDVTVGYPGVPPAGYGQSWYTIRSVFLDGVPPPTVHIHVRMYHVQRDIPIGDVGKTGDGNTGCGADATTEDKRTFEGWLLQRWREKDQLLDGFYREGRFWSGGKKPAESSAEVGGQKTMMDRAADTVEIPLEVRSWRGIADAFCWFVPVLGWYELRSFKRTLFK